MQVACAVERLCTVNLKESVDVRGFRLGMTLADIKNRFPGFPVVGANSIGVARVEIDGGYHSNRLGIDLGRPYLARVNDVVNLALPTKSRLTIKSASDSKVGSF